MLETSYRNLNETQKRLLDAAAKAMENAYCPYSGFHVGAALLSQDGRIFTGSNCENASYGLTMCAERAAIFGANNQGVRTFEKLAVIARGKDFDTTEVSGSCGACRQALKEAAQISERNLEIILSTTKKDKIVITTIDELLPLAFGPKDLGIDTTKYK